VQDFLKRIQELEISYHKVEVQYISQQSSIGCDSAENQTKLERLVEEIQELTLSI
jgi:hypothetical protein